jgi:purine-nucleoside phosphorylase
MNKFEKLFGIRPGQVRKNCILLPCINKEILAGLGVKNLKRGKLYGCADTGDFTLIHTGMGAGLAGDAVLYLKETSSQNVVLFGSCGSVGGLGIGNLVLPVRCLAQESFTEMLKNRNQESKVFYPDYDLTEAFLGSDQDPLIKKVTCMTISSLKLEEERATDLRGEGIDVVDMECSAFLSAAQTVKLKAFGLFYVSDVVGEKPFYEPLNQKDKKLLRLSIEKATGMLRGFLGINKNGKS